MTQVLHGLGVSDIDLETSDTLYDSSLNVSDARVVYSQCKLEAVALLLFVEHFKRISHHGKFRGEQRFIRAAMDEQANKVLIYSVVTDDKKQESNLIGVLNGNVTIVIYN